MKKEEFLNQQFLTLREEIRETKARIFKVISFGIIAVPAAHFLGKSYKLDFIVFCLPILVIVIALLYLAENHSLMRCGRYIREKIESEVEDVTGWEEWLEQTGGSGEKLERSVDKYLNYCVYLLFFIYYVASSFVAIHYIIDNQFLRIILLIFYAVIGIFFLIFLKKKIKYATSTK